jgi:hypothetical protein
MSTTIYKGRIIRITRAPGEGMNYQATLGNKQQNFLGKLYKTASAALEAAKRRIDARG